MADSSAATPHAPLHVQTHGQGSDLVLLHGWGMHSGIWEDVVEALFDHYRVTVVDLPGHGYSRLVQAGPSLAELARSVAEATPTTPAVWIGWSLGGLIAQRVAINSPERVAKLVLVGCSPCFVRRPAWPQAMDLTVLHQFAESLRRNYKATIKRFLALEVHGGEHASEQLRLLRELIFRHGEPDPESLGAGLEILRDTDLRDEIGRIHCPTLLLLGRRDSLVPVAAGLATAALLPNARLHVFARAAHAPFFSHLSEFIECLNAFLHD